MARSLHTSERLVMKAHFSTAARFLVKLCAASSLGLVLSGPAQAIDGCKLLLCMAGNWQHISQCTGIVREAKEELGLDITVKERLGDNTYETFHPERGRLRKHVIYFLAEAPFEDLTLDNKKEKGGLDDVKWFKLSDILDLNFYDDILPIITKAINLLVKN